MLHCDARRSARRAAGDRYIPLSEQDPHRWSLPLIEEAERHLAEASRHGRPGRFQLEAAIQSVHAERARSGKTEWMAIVFFYEQLVRVAPTLGAQVGHAAAVAEADGPHAGLDALNAIDAELSSSYQPYWAVRAHLLQQIGNPTEALRCFDRAIGLAEDPAVRAFLLEKRG
jgi:RNA polymerase sigma-70 factor (ECF subfamily)